MEKKEDIAEVLEWANEELQDLIERIRAIEDEVDNEAVEEDAYAVGKHLKKAHLEIKDCIDILESGPDWDEDGDDD